MAATFDSTKDFLHKLLEGVQEGRIQLPDFQRGWTWDDDRIRGLLASISQTYPIGVIMLLEAGGDSVRFQPRSVEGVGLSRAVAPERLILDGQQRLTSLFLALRSGKPVETTDVRGKAIKRWYYLDILKALDPQVDREDAIVALPEDKVIRNFRNESLAEYTTTEQECAAELLPLPLVFDTVALTAWMMTYLQQDLASTQEHLARWNALTQTIIQPFQQYQVPLIVLGKDTPKEAVCQVFEKVNTGGVALNVFELLTATYAADNFQLRKDWEKRLDHLRRYRVLSGLENTDFLQAVTLVASYARKQRQSEAAVTCKRKDILQLPLEDYRTWADPITRGFEEAARFLHGQKIFAARDLPYSSQLVPLAAIFCILGDAAAPEPVRARIARWYWCGVFGELYGSATETRFAKDVTDLAAWMDGGPEPTTISDAHFAPARLLTLRMRISAAYKGVSALLLHDGAQDFRTGEPVDVQMYFDESIDIHHIFPRAYCSAHGITPARFDCVVNKTPLSGRTNRIVGGNAPSVYLAALERRFSITPHRLDEILESHVIAPEALRTDDFDAFFRARQNALLDRIERAMGKVILRDTGSDGDVQTQLTEDSDELLDPLEWAAVPAGGRAS